MCLKVIMKLLAPCIVCIKDILITIGNLLFTTEIFKFLLHFFILNLRLVSVFYLIISVVVVMAIVYLIQWDFFHSARLVSDWLKLTEHFEESYFKLWHLERVNDWVDK